MHIRKHGIPISRTFNRTIVELKLVLVLNTIEEALKLLIVP